jgi:hypothetical protein
LDSETLDNRWSPGILSRSKAWTFQIPGILVLVFLTLRMSDSGMPWVNVYHIQADSEFSCCCGCECADDPHAAGSCLNPLNQSSIDCGCQKAHGREYIQPLRSLAKFILPQDYPIILSPNAQFSPHFNTAEKMLEGFYSLVVPPH